MNLVKPIYNCGRFSEGEPLKKEQNYLEKEALLCYPGTFMSMDGEVEVSEDHLSNLMNNHNSVLAKLKRLATGEIPMHAAPPLQLDHETKATHTVGRIVGPIELKEFDNDGVMMKGLFGKVRVLGKENMEKAEDGRWIHLSIGADLEEGKLNEVSVTPFPAAPNARMLSRFAKAVSSFDYKGVKITIFEDKVSTQYSWEFTYEGKKFREENFNSVPEAAEDAKRDYDGFIKGKMSRFALKTVNVTYHQKYKIEIFKDDSGKFGFTATSPDGRDGSSYSEFTSQLEALKAAKEEVDSDIKSPHMMSRLSLGSPVKEEDYKGKKLQVFQIAPNTFSCFVNEKESGIQPKSTVDDALQAVKAAIDENKLSRLSEGEEHMDYKSMKEKMDLYAKCKKHLMEGDEKMSEEKAEEKLASLADEDVKKMACEEDERQKKLAAEAGKGNEAKMARLAKMKAADEKLAASQLKVTLAKKAAAIAIKLSGLRASGKVTPAEIKTLNVDELAKEDQKIIDAKLSTYEARQPVIDAGIYGSVKATNLASIVKNAKMSDIEKRSRKNFSSLPQAEEKKMGAESDEHTQAAAPAKEVTHNLGDLEIIHKMMSEGKHDEAKEKMAAYMKKLSDGKSEDQNLSEKEAEKQLSALAAANDSLQNDIKEYQRLMAEMVG